MSTSVDRYFQLVDLFTPDGVLVPAGQDPLVGRDAIRANQAAFYANVSAASKHFHVITSEAPERIETDWAVAALMRAGGLLTLQGHNVYELADDGRISRLTVTNA